MRTALPRPASRARHHPGLRFQYTEVSCRPVPDHETPEASDPSRSADSCSSASDRPVRRRAARAIQQSCGGGSRRVHCGAGRAEPRCLSPAAARQDRVNLLGARGDDKIQHSGIDLLDGGRLTDRDIEAPPRRFDRIRVGRRGTRSGAAQFANAPRCEHLLEHFTSRTTDSLAGASTIGPVLRPLGRAGNRSGRRYGSLRPARPQALRISPSAGADAAPDMTPALGAPSALGAIGPQLSRPS